NARAKQLAIRSTSLGGRNGTTWSLVVSMLGCHIALVKSKTFQPPRSCTAITPGAAVTLALSIRLDDVQEALLESPAVEEARRRRASVIGESLERKVRARTARIAIVGLGYAGLPMAVELARAGFTCVGLDVDTDK